MVIFSYLLYFIYFFNKTEFKKTWQNVYICLIWMVSNECLILLYVLLHLKHLYIWNTYINKIQKNWLNLPNPAESQEGQALENAHWI